MINHSALQLFWSNSVAVIAVLFVVLLIIKAIRKHQGKTIVNPIKAIYPMGGGFRLVEIETIEQVLLVAVGASSVVVLETRARSAEKEPLP